MAALCSQQIRNERYWNTCAISGAKDALLPFVSSKLSKKTYREKLICAYPYTLANAWWDNNSCLLFKSSHYLTFHSYDNLSPLGKVEPYSSYIYVCQFVLYYAIYFLRFCFSFIANIHFYLKAPIFVILPLYTATKFRQASRLQTMSCSFSSPYFSYPVIVVQVHFSFICPNNLFFPRELCGLFQMFFSGKV